MVVLSRKLNESILIDGCIEIEIVQIKGGKVRLGVTAPQTVEIRRNELESYADPPVRTSGSQSRSETRV